jgi:serine phosphatase RsbU (regulator of sigma subunit)
VDAELKKSLNRNSGDRPLRDGMDIAFCCIDSEGKKLEFAGANNPLYIIRNKELIVLEADKQPITASRETQAKPFTNKTFDLQKGDCIYLFTDGYADQFGGDKGKKFLYKRFKEMLIDASTKPMAEQKSQLYHTFMNWKGTIPQIDDTLVIGIRV